MHLMVCSFLRSANFGCRKGYVAYLAPMWFFLVSCAHTQVAPDKTTPATTLSAEVQDEADDDFDPDDPEAFLRKYHYRCVPTGRYLESMPVRICLPAGAVETSEAERREAEEKKTVGQRYEEAYREHFWIYQMLSERYRAESKQKAEKTTSEPSAIFP